MAGTITPKGWGSFQHYRDRKPAWIKLHRDLLDNFDFHRLPVASRALAPCLWLLASEYDDGEIPMDLPLIAYRFRMSESELEQAITPLIEKGFFVASESLAGCQRDACLEREGERETEGEKEASKPAKPKREKAVAMGITHWLTALKESGERAIPEDDPIFRWSSDVGLPSEYLKLAWQVFKQRMADKGKKQADWRATFRTYVRGDYLKLWAMNANGEYYLTTAGKQEQLAHGA